MRRGAMWGAVSGAAMQPDEIRQRWPEATAEDVKRIGRYLNGDAFRFPAPPVCTDKWDALSWARFVTFD